MPFFSSTSSSTSVNEIIGGSGNSYTRKDGRPTASTTTKTLAKNLSRTRSLRRSVTDYQIPQLNVSYHNTFPNASTSQLDTSLPPPLYDEFDEIPLPKSRFKVIPRAEEGQETLPTYKCSLKKEAMFDRKIEMDSPFERAGDRKWTRVYCVLNNTVLNIHRVKRTTMLAKPDPLEENPDDPTGFVPGPLIKSFTLQHAEIGAASDYKKRNYVIRVRAETQQFLIACKTVETFFSWMEGLSSGIDLALPLEERSLPKYQTIPRRRRRRRAQDMVQQQEEIIRRHYPQLLNDDVPDVVVVDPTLDPNDRPPTSHGLDAIEESANVSDLDDQTQPSGVATPLSNGDRQFTGSIVDLNNLHISQERDGSDENELYTHSYFSSRPSTAPGGGDQNPYSMRGHLAGFAKHTSASGNEQETSKWRGGSSVSRESNLRFAKRCMAVLNANAPRQSDLVIDKGIRYKLVPGEYKMIPDSRITLPSYKAQKPYIYARVPLIDL